MISIIPKTKQQKIISLSILLGWFIFSFFFAVPRSSAAEPFPLYPCIQANVKFWEEIYSRYTTRQGLLHDIDDLNLVYAVVALEDWEAPGAAKVNSERVKEAKERIIALLTELGSGKKPLTPEEKKIASLFSGQPHSSYHTARENIRLQIGQKDRFYEGLIRSGKYLAHFKQYFISQGLPAELAYLPHVESSFNPEAYSKAGAAGLWQFTRSTGKEYLTINDQVDERYDPYLATQAAAKMLKGNHDRLETWPLALTAYNYGRAGMVRAVNDLGTYENIFQSYSQGYFKFASRNFYSEFMAALRGAKRLATDPSVPFERPEATFTFRLKQEVPLAQLQTSLRLSPQEFNRLNSALMEPVRGGQKPVPRGYQVRLPDSKKALIQQPRLTLTTDIPSKGASSEKKIETGRVHTNYTVQKGDTLHSIARRFQLPPQAILAANRRNTLAQVRIGERLIIPKIAQKTL